jgi:hypothetical protein
MGSVQERVFLTPLANLERQGLLPKANFVLSHLVAEAMHRAGLIDRHSTLNYDDVIKRFNLEPLIVYAANNLIRSIPHAYQPPTTMDALGRRAGLHLTHPGEVGTTFKPPAAATGQRREQAVLDRERGAANRPDQARRLSQAPPGMGHNGGPAWDNPEHPASRGIRGMLGELIASDWWLTAREYLEDYNIRVRRLQDMVEARTHDWVADNPDSPLPDNQQFADLKKLFPGKRANRMTEFNKAPFKPLMDLMKNAKITAQEASDYLQAKHAPERNLNVGLLYADQPDHDFYRAINDRNVVGASGMSSNEANRIVHEFESGPRAEAFHELARLVGNIRNFIKAEMLRGHLESQDTIRRWTLDSPNYVPLTGHEHPNEGPQFADTRPRPRRRGGGDVRGRETQQAFGRRTKADNSLISLMDQAYRTIDRAEKNLALHGLARMLKAVGPEVRRELGVTLAPPFPSKKAIDKQTGLVRLVPDAGMRWQPNVVTLKVRGKEQYIEFWCEEEASARRFSAQ